MGIISGASFSEVALGKPFVKTNYEKESKTFSQINLVEF